MAEHDTAGVDTSHAWTESTSSRFIDLADVYVPFRDEQIRTLVTLIPAGHDEEFSAVELGAGGGALARAVLESFPRCRYLALDGSAVMREQLRQVLAPFGPRVEVRDFELIDQAWRDALPTPLRAVLSSLVVHHLDSAGKRQLYADLARRLEPGGALLLADLVDPATPQATQLFARQWDDAARAQSLAKAGDLSAYERFQQDAWNFYTPEGADPTDKPSRLFEQLIWLRDAGFREVDAFWMYAGHAIYGGYR
jgi:tRNA (cmo5U34)-methyltransferase